LGWFLFLLAVAGGVAFAIWNFHRKTAARKAVSEVRFEKIFKGSAQVPASPPPPASAATESSAAAKALPAASAAPPAAAQRFLGEAESQLYYLLKSGLQDFEIFAGVSLGRVVGSAGDGREQQLRRLAQDQLDFVICDKSMQVVAVVEVEAAAGAGAAGDQRFKSDLLKQAGIRLVRINPAALPQREQIRTLIDGGSPR